MEERKFLANSHSGLTVCTGASREQEFKMAYAVRLERAGFDREATVLFDHDLAASVTKCLPQDLNHDMRDYNLSNRNKSSAGLSDHTHPS